MISFCFILTDVLKISAAKVANGAGNGAGVGRRCENGVSDGVILVL